MRYVLFSFLLAVSLTGSGCSFFYDLDSVEIPDSSDAATGADTGTDTAEPPDCDVFDSLSCTNDEYCALDIETGQVGCAEELDGTSDLNDSCENDATCSIGLRCVDWVAPDPRGKVCSQLCEISTGSGCGLGEFCTRTDGEFPGDLGFCTPRCDVLSVDACSDSEICVPAPYLPGDGFPPFSRCLTNSTDSQGGLGAGCDPFTLDTFGCESGLTCLTVDFMGDAGSFCLQPCQTLDECSEMISYSSCASIEGATNVGYCSP
jgi:hypothetical protein